MTRRPEISVVIPTCGRADILRDVLGALLRQTYDVGRLEIIVVVDGEDPATRALVVELGATAGCRMIALRQPRRGQGAARNHGIRHAAGRIILMLDDDIIAVPRLVEMHARHHETASDVVVTGPVPLEAWADEPAHHRDLRRWWDGELRRKSAPGHRPAFHDFTTGNVSVARARLLEAGGFDTAFSGYGREDYELGYRLLRSGLRFEHEVHAVGFHRYRKPPLQWLRQWRDMGRADVLFARKHPELTLQIMALCSFPPVSWMPAAVALGERLVLRLNRKGGAVWERSAGFVMASHYWSGVRAEVRDPAELARILRFKRAARRRWAASGARSRTRSRAPAVDPRLAHG